MDRIPFDPYDFFGYVASGVLVLVAMQLVFGFPQVMGHELRLFDSALVLLSVYVAGQLVATPAKALLEDLLVDKVLRRPSVNLFESKKPAIRGFVFPGFYKPLPEAIRKRILDRGISDGISSAGEELFLRVRYKPEILENESLMKKLDAFISKYGFSRNLAFTSVALGVSLLLKSLLSADHALVKYAVTALIAGILLLYRYLKFFRQYSYELFNVYGGK
jgi:hypothetical protein